MTGGAVAAALLHFFEDRRGGDEAETAAAELFRNEAAQEPADGQRVDELGGIGAVAVERPPLLAGKARAQRRHGLADVGDIGRICHGGSPRWNGADPMAPSRPPPALLAQAPRCRRHDDAAYHAHLRRIERPAMEPRLKTKVQVMAAVRLCAMHAIPITVARRGDEDAGTILVKLNQLERGITVLAQTRTALGDLAWLRATGAAPVDEATADAYIARQVKRDPDLWVVEIEDREGRPIFAGQVL
jgi:hypothetical protein